MNNTTIQYSTQRISPDLLSVLDVTQEGKIVSAQTWNKLWALVFEHINNINVYCLTIDALRIEWEKSKADLDNKIVDFDIKYAALKESFIHYGEQAPTNEHVKLWVEPLSDISPNLLVTQHMFKTGLDTKVDKFTLLYNVPKLKLYQDTLLNSSNYVIEQYLAAENITGLQYLYPDGGFGNTMSWPYTIPKGAIVTIVYSRGNTANQSYPARVTIFADAPWIVKEGAVGVQKIITANTGYYAIDYEITKSNGVASINSALTEKFYKAADVNVVRTTSVTLNSAAWSDIKPYSQVVNLSDVTANSKIDLTPTPAQLSTFFTKGYSFIIENKNKVVTAYCIGNKPTENYTITAAITEVAK